MTIEKKTNHVAEAIGNLIEQFKGKPNLEALISSYVTQIQDAENAAFQLITDRSIDTATGAQLDGIGQVVGLDRDGLSDDDYRTRLRVQIRLNLSTGTIEDVLTVATLITGGSVELFEGWPASIVVTIFELTEDPALVAQIISEARSAGVGSQLIYSPSPEGEIFSFASGSTPETDANRGFSNTSQTTGGKFAGVV